MGQMSGELVAAADIITGAAVARAVEPNAGEGKDPSDMCLNCGTALLGAHCHICGQKAKAHRTLSAFGHDILHSVLHFDGKIWHTLPMLFWKPGELTRRYVHGERAKFVSPLALFLFSVFLTFAVFNWMSHGNEDAVDLGAGTTKAEVATPEFAAEQRKLQDDIARLEKDVLAARKAGKPTQALEQELKSDKLGLKLMGTAANSFGSAPNDAGGYQFTDLEFPGAAYLNNAAETAKKNPQLLFYKMQSNAYKYSWALIPISVPFVWLLFFWRRRFKMFDHAVFVTYSLTFMMLLGLICGILISFGPTEPIGGLLLTFYPPIHMYRQLRQAYQTSRFGAFWRMCLLSVFAMTALTLFAVLVVAIGVS
jgi:hypothetical protein